MALKIPVTTAKAGRTFSKFELIKNFLRSSLGQDSTYSTLAKIIFNKITYELFTVRKKGFSHQFFRFSETKCLEKASFTIFDR